MRLATFLMRSVLPTEVPPYFWTISATSDLAKRDRRVGAAEAKGIGQRRADLHLARLDGHEVEVAQRILLEEVRGRRRDLIADREHREHSFDRRRRAQQMS